MNAQKHAYLLLFAFLICFSCSGKNEVIATFKNGVVQRKELDYELSKYPEEQRRIILNSSLQLRALVKELAIKKISCEYARTTNLIDVSSISNAVSENFKTELSAYLFKTGIPSRTPSINNEDIVHFGSTIKTKLIWFKTSPSFSEKEISRIYAKARRIRSLLRKESDFSRMANQNSDDPGNFRNGYLGPVQANTLEPEIIHQLYRLNPGEVSPVLISKLGYHVFKLNRLDQKRTPPVIDLSQILIQTNKEGLKRINSILELLKSGRDFGMLANQYSEDTANFKNGDLPVFNFARVYYPIALAAVRTKPGKISGIIKTKFGFFILMTETVTFPKNDSLVNLKKNQRYLNSILHVKKNFYRLEDEYLFKRKLRNNYKIEFNYTLFTNRTVNSNEILFSIPRLNYKKSFKECLPSIPLPLGPRPESEIATRSEYVFDKFIINELAFHYAKDKKLDKQEAFLLKMKDLFYDRIYQNLINTLKFTIQPSETELMKYYNQNKNRYRTVKIIKGRPESVDQSFSEAHPLVQRDYAGYMRGEWIQKWKEDLLDRYEFRINLDKLGLKKDADYYIKSGDRLYAAGEHKKALKNYLKAMQKEKNYTEAYIKVLMSYQMLNDPKNANKIFEELKNLKTIDWNYIAQFLDMAPKNLKIKLIELTGLSGERGPEQKLLEMYGTEKDVNILYSVIRSLGLLRSERAFSLFVFDLKNKNERLGHLSDNEREILKWYLIEALGYIGNKEITPLLMSELEKAGDLNLKCFIIEALGRIKDKRSIALLERYLTDQVWGIRILAAESLKSITGREYKVNEKKGAL